MYNNSRRSPRPSSVAALRAAPPTLRLTLILSFSLATALASMGAAQADPLESRNQLDPVVVTATRSPQRLSQVLADVTVLTRADIERQAYGGLADLLRSQACFELVRNGNAGANTSVYVRGAETRHTLVLIDGVRYDSQATSGASWQTIPLAQIERVEIVRGAASAIYGSDAVGGVVQIFTRKGDGKPQLELGSGFGNQGLAKVDASLSGLSGIVDYAVAAAGERSSGFNSRPSSDPTYTPDRDGYRSYSYSARVGAQLSREQRVELLGLKSHVDSQYDATAKPSVDDHNLNDMRVLRGSWASQWSQALNTELSIGESHDRYETRPSPYLTDTRVRSYTLNGGYKLGDGQFNGSLERREDKLENSGLSASPTPGQAERHQDAVALGYVWGAGPLSLQLHGRHDRDSEFGGSNTGTVAGGYQFAPGWRLLASYGTAFRAPTLYQRFSDYGNPGLVPEHGKNTELGLHFAQGASSASVTVYRNLVDKLIIFGDAGPCISEFGCYANVGQARLQGLSLKAGTEVAGLRLSGSLDLQAPKDVTEGSSNYGRLLARRSKQHASLRADTTLAGWDLGALWLLSGKRYDNAANTTKLGGYGLLGLDAQYGLSKQLRLQLKLDNAFNRAYQTAGGFASAPRQAFVGLRYTPDL
ncbi:MAG: TonB-dependent receptor [Burkholderiaceae bacterium]